MIFIGDEIKLTRLYAGGRIKIRRNICQFMSMNALIAGRLLKSAVVFLKRINLQIASGVKVRTPIGDYPIFIQNRQWLQHRIPAGMAAAAVVPVVLVVPVITNFTHIRSFQ